MKIKEILLSENVPSLGDSFDIELGNILIETGIIGFMPDGVIVESDSAVFNLFKTNGLLDTKFIFTESRMRDVDMIFRQLADGTRGITDVMNNPATGEERYVSSRLQDMFDEVIMDYDLNPDVDYN